jgi:2-polyprenyl-3-methyl-5-hydroxy-6-metoxy-1,4-benzoquinol methylase
MAAVSNSFVVNIEVDESLSSNDLRAKLEPFDSFWQAPDDIESGYPRFDAYYRANFLPLLPSDRNAEILVISCGPGYLVKVLAEEGYRKVLGIDSFPDKIAFAEKHGLNCRVERGFEHLKEQIDKYDVIVAEQELNHLTLDESLSFLALCRTSLHKDGLLLVYAMNGAHPLYGAENLAHNIDHFYTVTEFSLGQIMSAGGFGDVRIHPLKLYVFWRNPLNYVGLAITGIIDFFVKILFKLYAKDVKVLTKKIAASGRNPGKERIRAAK